MTLAEAKQLLEETIASFPEGQADPLSQILLAIINAIEAL